MLVFVEKEKAENPEKKPLDSLEQGDNQQQTTNSTLDMCKELTNLSLINTSTSKRMTSHLFSGSIFLRCYFNCKPPRSKK